MALVQGTADIFNSLPVKLPSRFAPESLSKATAAVRQAMYSIPSATGSFNSSQNSIKIMLPSTGVCDFSRGYFMFNVAFAQTGGTYARCHNGVWTMIDSIIVRSNGTTIEQADDYGDWMHLLYLVSREVNYDSYNYECGVGSQTLRNTWSAGRQYAIPLVLGCMSVQLWDLDKIRGGLEFEFILRKEMEFMESDAVGTALSYAVTNPMLHWENLMFTDPAAKANAMQQTTWACTTFRRYTINAQSNSIQMNVDHRSNAVQGVVTISQNLADLTNVAINDRLQTYLYNNMTEYQGNINGLYYPQRPVKVGPTTMGSSFNGIMGWIAFKNAAGKWSNLGNFTDPLSITFDQYTTNSYIQWLDLRSFPSAPQLINPVSFTGGTTNVQINMTMGSVPAAQQQISNFVVYTYLLTYDNGYFFVAK